MALFQLTRKLRNADLGVPYFGCFTVLGAAGPLTYTDLSTAADFTVDSAGRIIGAGQSAGPQTVSATASDGVNPNITVSCPVTVVGTTGTLAIDASLTPLTFEVGNVYTGPVKADKGRPPYALEVTSGGISPLSGTAATGFIAQNEPYCGPGTPGWITGMGSGSQALGLQLTDANGTTATTSITLNPDTVVRQTKVDRTLAAQLAPDAVVGSVYGWQPTITFQANTVVSGWSVLTGTLPAGTSINPTTGKVSGTPTGGGAATSSFTLRCTGTVNGSGFTADQAYTIYVYPNLSATRPAGNTGAGLFTRYGQLYSKSGKFIFQRAINSVHYDSGSEPATAKFGATLNRVFVDTSVSAATNITVLNNFLKVGVVPVFAFNNGGAGSDSFAVLQAVLDYLWTNRNASTTIAGQGTFTLQPYLNSDCIINFHNEWSASQNGTVCRDVHKRSTLNITSISGSTITATDPNNGTAFAMSATAVSLARVFLKGMSGAPDQYVTLTGGSNAGAVWTLTASAAITGSWTSGGTVEAGLIGNARAMGYLCPLMCDMASGYDQNYQDVVANAPTVHNSDPQLNTLQSMHMYGSFNHVMLAIQTLTKGNPTAFTATLPASLAGPNLGTAKPFFGGQTLIFGGIQGIAGINGQSGTISTNSGTSPNWNYAISVNSGGLSGSYVAGTGFAYIAADYRNGAMQIAGLQAQQIPVCIGEFGCASPPMSGDASSHGYTFGNLIAAAENCGVGWYMWAMDDGPTPPGMQAFGITGHTSDKGKYTDDTDYTYGGWGSQGHPLYSFQNLAQFVDSTGGVTPPGAPSGLTLTVISANEIDLNWSAASPGTNPLSAYTVQRSPDGANWTTIGSPAGLFFASTGLASATQYYYRVFANDNAGNPSASSSNVANATTSGGAGPVTPTVSSKSPNALAPLYAVLVNPATGRPYKYGTTGDVNNSPVQSANASMPTSIVLVAPGS